MITKLRLQGYRLFRDTTIRPRPGLNILVGDNEAGKSTVLEALNLGMTGRINGRAASEELNPFWFNRAAVEEFFRHDELKTSDLPTITIEIFFADTDDLQRLRGANNTLREDCPGVSISIHPDQEYTAELAEYLADKPSILPVEYYEVEWQSFADQTVSARPKELAVSFIDSRTVRSTSGIDYHMREILRDHLTVQERAQVSLAFRKSSGEVSDAQLRSINERIAAEHADLNDSPVGLALDQTSKTSWESIVSPSVDDIPFSLAGQGQQATIKITLAMRRSGDRSSYVLVEEPENHLSHTSLTKLIGRMQRLASETKQQLFVTTHSSFVLNRFGLDALTLLHKGTPTVFQDLERTTVGYFQKLSGYDTLRLVLAKTVILVEGPSDQMVFEHAFHAKYGRTPMEDGVDVVALNGVALARGLELGAALDRRIGAIRDNDGETASHWEEAVAAYLKPGVRELFIGQPSEGTTLEPQMISANGDEPLRQRMKYTGNKTTEQWMLDNKTEAALRLTSTDGGLQYPDYIDRAVVFAHG